MADAQLKDAQREGLWALWAGIREGREHRRRRATLRKQIDRLDARIGCLSSQAVQDH
jgi:hypothetical protein